MVYAAYRESMGAALLVRRALISCPETGVLRCHLQRHGMTQGF